MLYLLCSLVLTCVTSLVYNVLKEPFKIVTGRHMEHLTQMAGYFKLWWQPPADQKKEMATNIRGARRKATAVMALLTILVGVAAAQERFGEINGVAYDASGDVDNDVHITLTHMVSGRCNITNTHSSGTY